MEITIKEIEPCKLSVHYVGDTEQILNKRSVVIEQFKNAPVPGFRKGKANSDAIKMHYRDQIEESLKRALAEDAYHDVIFEKKLRPHGQPRINNLLMVNGKFTCDFDLFVKPDFELVPYQNMEVPKPHDVQNADFAAEAMLQEIRIKFGDVLPYTENDFVQNGDNVILDYQGFVEGLKIDGLGATGEMLTVGKSQLPAFDDNLLGMKLGETREFDMVAPETGLPSLAGKTIRLQVILNMGAKTIPAGLDDTLAQKVGKKDYAELREFVYGLAVSRVSQHYTLLLTDAVARRLLADNTVNVPLWMSVSEAQYLVHQAKIDWAKLADVDKEKYIEMGKKNVKLALILDKVRELEVEAQLSDQEVFEVVKQNLMKTQTNANLDDVMKEMNRTGYLQVLFSRIRDEYTLSFLVKSVKIIE
jgi:trigger factor